MKKRLKFQCWNCRKTYTLLREIEDLQKLIVACPYCNTDAVVDLDPFRKPTVTPFRGGNASQTSLGTELDLPETLPTQKPE